MERDVVAPPARRVASSGALLLAGTLSANLLSYAFFLILSRGLAPGALGAVGAMVNLSAIATVPALGLQLVAAREVSRDQAGDTAAAVPARMLRIGLEIGAATAVVLTLAMPAVIRLLHVEAAPVLLLAAGLVPMAVVYALQGVLQGRERFGRLALVLAASGVAKPAAALVAVWAGGSVTVVMGGLALGWALTAALALLLSRPRRGSESHGSSTPLRRAVVAATVPTSGLLLLSSLDVLLARHHLVPADSGAYTVGALFEKAAFWGLAFLATLFYPAMARPAEHAAATLRALAVTAGLGAVGVAFTFLTADLLVDLAAGPGYAALAPDLWRFTALGSLLAIVQVLVYAGLAQGRVQAGVAVWFGGVVAALLVQGRNDSVHDVVTVMLAVVGVLVLTLLALEARGLRGPARVQAPG